MNRKTTISLLAFATVVATTLSYAVPAAASAAAAAKITLPALPPPPPPPTASVSGAVSGSVQATGGAATSAGVNASATAHATTMAGTNPATASTALSDHDSVSVNPTEVVNAINSTSFAARAKVTDGVQARLEASDHEIDELRAKAEARGEKAREAFAKELVQLREQEKAVRLSLKASLKAWDETAWGESQSALARNYGAYARAMIHARAVAQGAATVSSQP